MAKLKARGRHELARVALTRSQETHPNMIHKFDGSSYWDSIDSETITRAIMSDGHLLEKRKVHFKADAFNKESYSHDWGWKDIGKIKAGFDIARWLRDKKDKGWKILSGTEIATL